MSLPSGMVSHEHAHIYIYIPKSADTGRAHEHTGFWCIYGRAYENPVLWCLISTLIYLPNSADTGC